MGQTLRKMIRVMPRKRKEEQEVDDAYLPVEEMPVTEYVLRMKRLHHWVVEKVLGCGGNGLLSSLSRAQVRPDQGHL